MLLAHALGFVPLVPALATIAAVIVVNVGVYLLFKTRLNLRFADPSLTWLQIVLATAMVMAGAFVLDHDRSAALILCPVLLMYGVFRFTTRQFLQASVFVLACYALVVALVLLFKPASVSLPLEIFRLAVLACVLPCFALAGGKMGEMRARLRDSNEDLGAALAKIKQLATHDTLTGLPNRALFTESLTRALARAERHGWPVALFFMDLDRFKNINDTLGHQLGDEALKEAARRISSCIRDSDISARLGGDEFVLLVEEFEGPTVLIEIAERILAAIYQPLSIGGHELNLSASIGICTFPIDAKDAGTLLANADIAMYQAKEQGRNRYRFYSPRFNEHSVERLALETGLRYAIEREELVLLYQPKISIPTGRIVGVEALLRWQHPELGLLRPDRFIPLAEESGLIVPIGLWVLRTACATARLWREAGMPMPVAVNLSARQFHDGRLGGRPRAGRARARDNREHGDAEPGAGGDTHGRDPPPRRAPRDGRFRHRLFVNRAPEALSDRQPEARPHVRARPARRHQRRRDHPRRHRHGAHAAHQRNRRGRRARVAAGLAARRRLRRIPGLPVPAAACAGRARAVRARQRIVCDIRRRFGADAAAGPRAPACRRPSGNDRAAVAAGRRGYGRAVQARRSPALAGFAATAACARGAHHAR